MREGEFFKLLNALLKNVVIIPNQVLIQQRKEAIAKDIDPNDAVFFACALANKNSIIWSDDKKLKLQNKITVINTAEMKEII